MPRFTDDQKLMKGLKFLMSFLDRDISNFMKTRGFTQDTLSEGWALFNEATGSKISLEKDDWKGPVEKNILIAEIDNWENIWLDVAEAALTRFYPKIKEELFLNIHRESGIEVVANVQNFLGRYDELASKDDEDSKNAIKILASRGMNADNISSIKALISDIEIPKFDKDVSYKQILENAMNAFWAWYVDWSKTARTCITQKRLRIKMGLSTPARKTTPEVETE